ncbi:MAG: segregation/condensation protein A [Candidatus Wallbacteria bacterium]|nr:segregation/condensation protein A [Candidatus Wallbacteria bacterium]
MQALAESRVLDANRADPGIDLLVEMAERNEIDPWDIDIIQVTNRYLLRLDELGQANLPVTGKMFFYAAVLLRMKAEALARQCDLLPAIGSEAEGEGLEDGAYLELLPDRLRRRRVDILVYPKPQHNHRRPITLKDLIDALTLYERQSAARRLRAPGVMAAEDVIESTHQDHIGNDIERIQEVLTRLIGEMTGEVRFDFKDLLVDGLSAITAFMALMFLASDGVVDFEQEFFYGDLVVKRA